MAKTKNKKNKNRNLKNKLPKVKSINIFLIILIFGFSVYYIFGVNDLSVKGFRLFEFKSYINELKEDYSYNELRAMELEAFDSVFERATTLGMVEADRIDYYTIKEEVVAKVDN